MTHANDNHDDDVANISDELAAKLFDYEEGTALSASDRAEVEAYLASHNLPLRPSSSSGNSGRVLGDLPREQAPGEFTQHVTETIRKRSAGRFFAKRTLGDRIPFGALLIIAFAILAIVAGILWSSNTGSLRVHHDEPANKPPSGDLAPRP